MVKFHIFGHNVLINTSDVFAISKRNVAFDMPYKLMYCTWRSVK